MNRFEKFPFNVRFLLKSKLVMEQTKGVIIYPFITVTPIDVLKSDKKKVRQ